MKNNEKKMKILIELAAMYNKDYPKPVLERMLKAVDDMSVDELELAANIVIQNNSYPPAIADLWKIVNDKRDEETHILSKKVAAWMMKNTTWDYSQQPFQEDVDEALVAMGLAAGSLDVGDI